VEVAVVGVIAKHRETDTDARDEIGRQQQNKMESWPSPDNLGFLFYWIHKKILHFIGFYWFSRKNLWRALFRSSGNVQK
jgi:hypothetical protein